MWICLCFLIEWVVSANVLRYPAHSRLLSHTAYQSVVSNALTCLSAWSLTHTLSPSFSLLRDVLICAVFARSCVLSFTTHCSLSPLFLSPSLYASGCVLCTSFFPLFLFISMSRPQHCGLQVSPSLSHWRRHGESPASSPPKCITGWLCGRHCGWGELQRRVDACADPE